MLLDQVEQSPGAMASPAPGRFRFLHLSFQEYLAACDMLYRPGTAHAHGWRLFRDGEDDERPFPDELVRRVLQAPRLWANVLRLAVDESAGERPRGRRLGAAGAVLPTLPEGGPHCSGRAAGPGCHGQRWPVSGAAALGRSALLQDHL